MSVVFQHLVGNRLALGGLVCPEVQGFQGSRLGDLLEGVRIVISGEQRQIVDIVREIEITTGHRQEPRTHRRQIQTQRCNLGKVSALPIQPGRGDRQARRTRTAIGGGEDERIGEGIWTITIASNSRTSEGNTGWVIHIDIVGGQNGREVFRETLQGQDFATAEVTEPLSKVIVVSTVSAVVDSAPRRMGVEALVA